MAVVNQPVVYFERKLWGVRDSEPTPRLTASWSNRSPLPLVATDPHFYVILRFERVFSAQNVVSTKIPNAEALGIFVGTV